MRVGFCNRSYYPDPEATGKYLTELPQDVAARGIDVSVVCPRSYHFSPRRGLLRLSIRTRNGVQVKRHENPPAQPVLPS